MEDWRKGWVRTLKSVRAEAAIQTVRERIRRNALETKDHVPMNILIRSILCIIRDDQHKKAHRHSKEYLLTPVLKEIRRTRAERLLQWHAKNGHDNNLFTDEKIFTIEKHTTTRSIQPPEQDLCSNVSWGAFRGCREAITFPTSWFGGGCPIRRL